MQLSKAALRWINDLLAQGILVTDAELNICGWNQWLESRTGKSAAEMAGRNLLEAYPDLVARRFDQYYVDALAHQVRVVSQRLHGYLLPMTPTIEGSNFALMQQSARIAPLIDEGRVIGTITVIEDVTERVERENRLVELLVNEKAARTEAEAANRAKDEFLATISHEIRTPLNAIFGWLQILRDGRVDIDSSTHVLDSIERNAKAQAKLIEDILDASRIVTGNLRLDVGSVDLASIIEAAVDTVRPAANAKSIQLEMMLDPQAERVSGDPHRLQQVVWNLLFNAIKFTPVGGRVKVRLRRTDSDVEVIVDDTGEGISPEFLPHVFDRFRQADSTTARKHGGLGLGLAIVRNLVELHGGTVHVDSEGEGCGATFTVRLPLGAVERPEESLVQGTAPAAEPEAAAIGSNPAPRLDNVRVLVVDNDSDAREILDLMLTQCGAKVTTATNAPEALEVLREAKQDVLVSDIGMPGEDGYWLINKVRTLEHESERGIPAVALTGYAGPEERLRLLSAGYQVHVAKPVELNELAVVIASLAEGLAKGRNA
jgi:PAS domain S-box-containing protein